MSHVRRVRLAFLFTTAGLLLYVLAGVLGSFQHSALSGDGGPWYGRLIDAAPMLLGLVLGSVLIVRRPENPYGWVWVALGLVMGGLTPAIATYAIVALMVAPGTLPLGWAAASVWGTAWFVGLALMPLVLLLFPTGHPPTPRWRILLWLIGAALILGLSTAWSTARKGLVPLAYPYQIESAWGRMLDVLSSGAVYLIFFATVASVVSLLYRYRLAGQPERKQLKWFAYGAVVFLLVFASDLVYTAPGAWDSVKEALALAILPVTIGIAVLRNRLWDIDVIIRKTLVYGVLTGLLALVYLGGVVLLQRLVGALTGVEQSPLAVAVSTLAIVVLFTPLRRRIQDFIDGRFYRKKYDAQQVLAQFALTARDETDLDALTGELVRVVGKTLQPEGVSVWLRGREQKS